MGSRSLTASLWRLSPPSYGPISGLHVNPAVTISVLVAKHISPRDAGLYIVVQVLGGIVGALLSALRAGGAETGLGATVLAQNLRIGDATVSVTPLAGLTVEIILTFFLANAVLYRDRQARRRCGASRDRVDPDVLYLDGRTVDRCEPQPRADHPAIAAGIFSDIWLYIVGPVAGGVLAALSTTPSSGTRSRGTGSSTVSRRDARSLCDTDVLGHSLWAVWKGPQCAGSDVLFSWFAPSRPCGCGDDPRGACDRDIEFSLGQARVPAVGCFPDCGAPALARQRSSRTEAHPKSPRSSMRRPRRTMR